MAVIHFSVCLALCVIATASAAALYNPPAIDSGTDQAQHGGSHFTDGGVSSSVGGFEPSNFVSSSGPAGSLSFASGSQAFGGSPRSSNAGVPFSGSGNALLSSVNNNVAAASHGPIYEEHVLPRAGKVPVTRTVVNKVTKTHTLRVPSTSDVWITSVKMVTVPCTQLTTQRSYVPVIAETVTSVIRITQTPISVATRTAEIFPTKTMVSVFTRFVTDTQTVELWQPIVHRATSYEVMTVPVLETQTLLQRLFTTTTITTHVNFTSVRPVVQPRGGRVPSHHRYF